MKTENSFRKTGLTGLLFYLLLWMWVSSVWMLGQQVTSPEEFFGFQLGSDRKIARWDTMVEFYQLLERQSKQIKVLNMGPSTEGNPFLLVIISSETLATC